MSRDYFKRKDVITKDIARKRIYDTHDGNIDLLVFKGSHYKASLHCNICGKNWDAVADTIWRGQGCPVCGLKKRAKSQSLGIEYVINYILSENCKLLSKNYKNTKEKLEIQFECGHIGNMSFDCFKRGQRCKICSLERIHLAQRFSMNELNEILLKKDLVFIGFPNEYTNRNSEITCKCSLGHIETRRIATVLSSVGCSACTLIKASINQSGAKGSNWQGGKTKITSFLKKQITQWKKDSIKNSNYCCVICGEGHRFEHVHHLQSFSAIFQQTMAELEIDIRPKVRDYTENELFLMINKLIEIHYRYPLGVCLCWKHHKAFHFHYGLETGTPKDFYEFQQRIKSGEIIIPD